MRYICGIELSKIERRRDNGEHNKIKRGLSSNIDNITLAQGELAITTDTQDLYVGTDSGNKKAGGVPKIY